MTHRTIKTSAPGKIHFMGEHTAVYGKPALLAAINKRCYVELTPRDSAEIKITSKNFERSLTVSFDEIAHITAVAQAEWERYRKTNDISILKGVVEDDALYPVIAIGETLKFFQHTPTHGFHLQIDSHIPIGSGHGSSAAVAVSVASAIAAFLGESPDNDVISQIAIRTEQKKHGNPSYGDVGAVINGGLIWFQKKTPEEIIIEPLDVIIPETFVNNLLVIQSGVPEESTGEMVHFVAEFKKHNPVEFERVLEEQSHRTHELLEAIKQSDEQGIRKSIRVGEKNLETIGVVSAMAMEVIREVENSGGVAKICGAGGKKNGAGIILVYHKEKPIAEAIAKARGLDYYTVQLGGKGIQLI